MVKASVGICAMNEEDTVGRLIDQIMAEEVDLQEVVVVAGGTDSTVDIVEEKAEEYDQVELVRETERRGQALAQNDILSRATGDAIFLIDGDGLIEPGSLEKMMEVYDGECLVHGRETPVVGDSFRDRMVEKLWEIHHRTCLESPKFSTQLGLMPADLVDEFPEVVLDDTYVQLEAERRGYDTIYEPEAVKYHDTSTRLRYYLVQREKNKSGIYQLKEMGYEPEDRSLLNLRKFLRELYVSFPDVAPLLALFALEGFAFMTAQPRRLRKEFPNKWSRPGSMEEDG